MSTRGLKFKFSVAEHVLCFEPDPSKARVLYNAKILEHVPASNKEGSRIPEYHVHFQGWNNSWDRIVNESFILEDDETNRALMKKVASMARKYHVNRWRIRKIDDILRRSGIKKPKFSGEMESSSEEEEVGEEGSSESEEDVSEGEGDDNPLETSCEDDGPVEPVEIEIPETLKDILSEDNDMILRQTMYVKLPAVPNIVTILENYVTYFIKNNSPKKADSKKSTPENSITVCKEMADGIRVCFDFLLPLILLYGDERGQYEEVRRTFVYKPLLSVQPPIIKKEIDSSEYNQVIEAKTSYFGERIRRTSDRILNNSPPLMVNNSTKLTTNGETDKNTHGKNTQSKPNKNAKKHNKKLSVPLKDIKKEEPEVQSRRVTRTSLSESLHDISDPSDADISFKNSTFYDKIKRAKRKKKSSGWGRKKNSKKQEHSENDVLKFKSSKLSGGGIQRINQPSLTLSVTRKKSPRDEGKMDEDDVISVGDEKMMTPLLDMAIDDVPKRSFRLRKSSGRDTPPPPLLKRNSVSTESNKDSDDTVPLKGRIPECEGGKKWALLPDDVICKHPSLPCVIYGAHHLLRLFVKLPDLLSEMRLKPEKLQMLLSHFYLFFQMEEKYVSVGRPARSVHPPLDSILSDYTNIYLNL